MRFSLAIWRIRRVFNAIAVQTWLISSGTYLAVEGKFIWLPIECKIEWGQFHCDLWLQVVYIPPRHYITVSILLMFCKKMMGSETIVELDRLVCLLVWWRNFVAANRFPFNHLQWPEGNLDERCRPLSDQTWTLFWIWPASRWWECLRLWLPLSLM